jgi:hypothetical protein
LDGGYGSAQVNNVPQNSLIGGGSAGGGAGSEADGQGRVIAETATDSGRQTETDAHRGWPHRGPGVCAICVRDRCKTVKEEGFEEGLKTCVELVVPGRWRPWPFVVVSLSVLTGLV